MNFSPLSPGWVLLSLLPLIHMLSTSWVGRCGSPFSYMVSLPQLVLFVTLMFTCPPKSQPPSYHSSSRSRLPKVLTLSDSLPDIESLENFTLPTYTNIFLITSKVHTIAVKSVFSLWPQNILIHDAYCPLEMLFPHPFTYQTFQNQVTLPSAWHIQWVPLSLIPLWLPPYLPLTLHWTNFA